MEVPRKAKKKSVVETTENGVNGTGAKTAPEFGDSSKGKRKRDAEEAELDITEGTPVKKMHLTKSAEEKEILLVEDDDGAIVLD